MRALLLLTSLSAAVAAEPSLDPSAPGFWTKAYSFPSVGCSMSLRLIVSDAPAALKRVEKLAGEGANFDGATVADWNASPEEFPRSKKTLLGLGEVDSYSESCAASGVGAYPELDYKKEALAKEKAAAIGALSDYPAISGLLDAELATLDRMIQARDQARRYEVHVELIDAKQASAEDSGAPRVREKRAHRVRRRFEPFISDGSRAWGRSAVPTCERFSAAILGVPPGELEKWKKSLLKAGADYKPDGCGFYRNSVRADAAVWAEPARLEAVKNQLMKSGRMTRWEPETPATTFVGALSNAEKSERLTAELQRSSETLKAAPNIRALVRAELDRIEPSAFNEAQGRTRRLVYLIEGIGH